jgi:hypothetical protein
LRKVAGRKIDVRNPGAGKDGAEKLTDFAAARFTSAQRTEFYKRSDKCDG